MVVKTTLSFMLLSLVNVQDVRITLDSNQTIGNPIQIVSTCPQRECPEKTYVVSAGPFLREDEYTPVNIYENSSRKNKYFLESSQKRFKKLY